MNQAKVELEGRLLGVLIDLPDPAGTWSRKAMRASEFGEDEPYLDWLEVLGYAENNRGWWRKTREGVMKLREIRAAEEEARNEIIRWNMRESQ